MPSGRRKPLANASQPIISHSPGLFNTVDSLLLLASWPRSRDRVVGAALQTAPESKRPRRRKGARPTLGRGADQDEIASRPCPYDPRMGRRPTASAAAGSVVAAAVATVTASAASAAIAFASSASFNSAAAASFAAAITGAPSIAAPIDSAAAADAGGCELLSTAKTIGTHCGGQETPPTRGRVCRFDGACPTRACESRGALIE